MIKKYFLPLMLLLAASCSDINVDKLIEEGKFKDAAVVLEKRYALSRDEAELKKLIILYNNELSDVKRAKELLMDREEREGALKGSEDLTALIYYNYAQALYVQAKADSVKYFLNRVLMLQPDNPKVYLLMGKTQMRSGDFSAGETNLRMALKIDSTLSDAYVFLGNSKALNSDFSAAEVFYQKALRTDSMNYEAWMNMGIAKEYFKKRNEAVACYKRAVSINPKRKDAYDYVINIYSEMNMSDSAFKYMEQYQNLTGDIVKYDRSYRQ